MRRIESRERKSPVGRTACALFLLVTVSVLGLSTQAFGSAGLGSYLALKGGIYSPSASFNLENINVERTFESDTQTGASGEIALGHYFLPTLALELGVGYFKGKGTLQAQGVTGESPKADFNVIPIVVSAKALIPTGPVDPYGEVGIGAYFTKFDVSHNLNTFDGTTTFGLHAGAGMNVNLSPNSFFGVEGRYVWANPSFGDQKIKLNDTEYALNGFELNGFTTVLAFGLNF